MSVCVEVVENAGGDWKPIAKDPEDKQTRVSLQHISNNEVFVIISYFEFPGNKFNNLIVVDKTRWARGEDGREFGLVPLVESNDGLVCFGGGQGLEGFWVKCQGRVPQCWVFAVEEHPVALANFLLFECCVKNDEDGE